MFLQPRQEAGESRVDMWMTFFTAICSAEGHQTYLDNISIHFSSQRTTTVTLKMHKIQLIKKIVPTRNSESFQNRETISLRAHAFIMRSFLKDHEQIRKIIFGYLIQMNNIQSTRKGILQLILDNINLQKIYLHCKKIFHGRH